MILNPFLFENIYKCYLNYNVDIIEYTVFHLKERLNKVFYPIEQEFNHYHNYSKTFIYQPELSNIIYYNSNTKKYSRSICRTIWNKIYKRNIVLNSIKYIGDSYYKNHYIIVIEDTLLNTVIFNLAKNYTNLNIPGYLYNIRESSITHLKEENDYLRKKSISFLLYYQILYRLIKDFDKDRKFLYYELRLYGRYILNLVKINNTKYYLGEAKMMLNEVINDKKTNKKFKNYIKFSYKSLLK
jgi:hypothetical protein